MYDTTRSQLAIAGSSDSDDKMAILMSPNRHREERNVIGTGFISKHSYEICQIICEAI